MTRIRGRLGRGAAAVACAVLLAAPPAWAVSQQYNGPAAGGVGNAGVEFGARLSGEHPVQVRRFSWFNLPVTCGGTGRSAVSDTLAGTMRVSASRRFSATGRINGGLAKVTVKGRFSKSFGRASGTLRLTGTVSGCPRADSGQIRWSAPRVGRPS